MGIRVTKTHNKDGSVTKRTTVSRKTILGTRKTETFVERIPAKQKKGCYVATSIYGSYDCPSVWTLRRFRDEYLAKRPSGRCFIKAYYAISPTLVKLFEKMPVFTSLLKKALDHFVTDLKRKGYSDLPYND